MNSRVVYLNCLVVFSALALLLGTQAQLQGAAIYSDTNDGFIEVRDTLPPTSPWPVVHPDSFGTPSAWHAQVGEWFGPGLVTIVLPFELPDFGAVANPFTSADLGVMVHEIGGSTVTDIDLYAVRTDSNPAIVPSDFYVGSAFDPNATLIQESFLTPSSPSGFDAASNNNTDATGDANLLSYMNTAYDSGNGAGDYVFLRLSYGADTFATGFDAYLLTMREAGIQGEWPVITYEAVPEPTSMALVGLGSVVYGIRRRREK